MRHPRRVTLAMRRGPRLAEILLQSGLVKEDDLRRARQAAEERGGSLLLQLARDGSVEEAELVRALGRALRMPTVSLQGKRVDPEVLRLISPDLAEQYGCVPLFVKEEDGSRALYLGVEDPTDQAVADDVSFRVGLRVHPVVVGPLELRRALRGEATLPAEPREPAAPPLAEQALPPRDTEPEFADSPAPGPPAEAQRGAAAPGGAPPRSPPRRLSRSRRFRRATRSPSSRTRPRPARTPKRSGKTPTRNRATCRRARSCARSPSCCSRRRSSPAPSCWRRCARCARAKSRRRTLDTPSRRRHSRDTERIRPSIGLEHTFELDQVEVPRFSVEAVEGIGKVFTLATLVLNVLDRKSKVELVFHGLNQEDPGRKIEAFKLIVESAQASLHFRFREGQGGSVPGSSSYYQWLIVERSE